ncbi:hypothetical protein, partial [Thermococcus sp. GR4]|uniref:hypothetical protein n=1 Tax=Thermococcus sp. GR4 TaxID=1638254 RepID=UPI00197E6240
RTAFSKGEHLNNTTGGNAFLLISFGDQFEVSTPERRQLKEFFGVQRFLEKPSEGSLKRIL